MTSFFSADSFVTLRQKNLASFEELSYPDWRKAKMAKVDVKEAFCRKDKGGEIDWVCADKMLAEKGVVVTRLADMFSDDGGLGLSDVLHRLDLGVSHDKLAAFHWANVNDGLVIVVPRRTKVDAPIRVSTKQMKDSALASMVVLVIGEGAEVEVEESFGDRFGLRKSVAQEIASSPHTTDPSAPRNDNFVLCSTSTHILVGQEAAVKYSCVQNWGTQVYDLGYRQLVADKDAKIEAVFGLFGAGAGRTVIQGVTRGQGAEVRHSGIFVGGDSQRLKLITKNLHYGHHSKGRMLYKGTLADKAQADLESLIYVDAKAGGTSSELVDATLLLSSDARADSTPALDVHTDDVQCRHAASVKQTDKEQLFYLMTRGLDRAMAQRLVVEGFFDEVLRGISDKRFQESMREMVGAG